MTDNPTVFSDYALGMDKPHVPEWLYATRVGQRYHVFGGHDDTEIYPADEVFIAKGHGREVFAERNHRMHS